MVSTDVFAVSGVYGDRGGGWVTEEDEPWPAAPRTKARLKAERSWLRLHVRDMPRGIQLQIPELR